MRQKIVYISVTTDIVHDQRVCRTAGTLMKSGARVNVVGRRIEDSIDMSNLPFRIKRFRMLVKKGPLFYAFINIRLFFFLLFKRVDILVANDLDTLLPNYLISRLKKKTLIYDSHEYFTGVPEIQNRSFVKWVWNKIEKCIFPRLKNVYTVSAAIAGQYQSKYKVNVEVIRNLPLKWNPDQKMTQKSDERISEDKVIILQGTGINIDRGAEEAVEAMNYVQDAVLWIIGCGDVIGKLKNTVLKQNLQKKIRFFDRMPYNDLKQYTAKGDLGLSLDKSTNPNYRMSLPNKLFDYIQAEIPVLASDLPEVAKILREYGVGELIESHDPKHIAEKITYMLHAKKKREEWKKNLTHAAETLNWENEEKKLMEIYEKAGLEF